MQKSNFLSDKYYVRVYISGPESDKYLTLGPYFEEKALKMVQKYLSTGVCSWVERVERVK